MIKNSVDERLLTLFDFKLIETDETKNDRVDITEKQTK